MNLTEVLISQYQASLEMFKQTITKCPELLWNSPGDKAKFWQIAYHALFYTHLYLQELRADLHTLGQASRRISVPWTASLAAACAAANW